MPKLNHINLAVSDVPEVTRFFTRALGFRVHTQRGQNTFSVLTGEDGFVMILMKDKRLTPETYPALFHVGFLVDSQDEVHRLHQQITEAGFDCPTPTIVNRGGPPTFGFYCKPPGGVLIEVSTPA